MSERDTDMSAHQGGGDMPPSLSTHPDDESALSASVTEDDSFHHPEDADEASGVLAEPSPKRRRVLSRRLAVTLIILGIFGLFLGASALVVQPEACRSCHKPQAAELAKSTHVEVTCAECHTAGGRWGAAATAMRALFVMVPQQIAGGGVEGQAGVRISRDACEQCHSRGMDTVVAADGMRINHGTCAAPPAKCDACHGAVAHGATARWPRAPEMEPCISCHQQAAASTDCDLCHAGKLPKDRIVTGPWRITHGKQWQSTHGMGDLASCATCHEAQTCVKCHNIEVPHPGGFLVSHGKAAMKSDNKCSQCHKDPAWCVTCHGLEMPHPKGFIAKHSTIAKGRRDPNCVNCHRADDCARCHEKHVHPGLPDEVLRTLSPRGGRR